MKSLEQYQREEARRLRDIETLEIIATVQEAYNKQLVKNALWIFAIYFLIGLTVMMVME